MSHYLKAESILSEEYNFQYDIVKNRVNYSPKCQPYFKILDNYSFNSILRFVRSKNVRLSRIDLAEILNSDFVEIVDPISSFLESLTPWNPNDEDYILKLSDTVTVPVEQVNRWAVWFKKWFVAMVAGSMGKGFNNPIMLILQGPQRIGKTTWIRKNVPFALRRYYHSGSIIPGNKDHEILLAENYILIWDELDDVSRRMAAMKELLDKPFIQQRRPFTMLNESFTRRASLIGSINKRNFLDDPTGTRRFLTFEVTHIEDHNINVELAYAQAFSLIKSGFDYTFSSLDARLINKQNENFTQKCFEVEILESILESGDKNNCDLFCTTTELLVYLLEHHSVTRRMTLNKLGSALYKMGIYQTKRNGLWKWYIKLKS